MNSLPSQPDPHITRQGILVCIGDIAINGSERTGPYLGKVDLRNLYPRWVTFRSGAHRREHLGSNPISLHGFEVLQNAPLTHYYGNARGAQPVHPIYEPP